MAVTIAVSKPKQRLRPRAKLYSPPPSETSKVRVVQMRRSPGSKRNITSPRLTRSQRHDSFALILRGIFSSAFISIFIDLFIDRISLVQFRLFQVRREQVND